MSGEYVYQVLDLADEFQRHQAEKGASRPDQTALVHDSPEVLAQLGEETPLTAERIYSSFQHNCIDPRGAPAAQALIYQVPNATVIDDEGKVVLRGDLWAANMEGCKVSKMSAKELAEIQQQEEQQEVFRNKINVIVPMGGLAKLVFEDNSFVMIESGFGIRQLVSVLDVEVLDMKGQEIAYWGNDGLMQGFMPWQMWVEASGADIDVGHSLLTTIPELSDE